MTEEFSVPWRNKQCSEFANTTFAATGNKKSTHRKRHKVMKMKNKVINVIITVAKSKWTRLAPMTLALLVAILGVTGCQPHH